MQHPVDSAPVIPPNPSTHMSPQAPNPMSTLPANTAPVSTSSPISSAVPMKTGSSPPSKNVVMVDQLGLVTQIDGAGQDVSSNAPLMVSPGNQAHESASMPASSHKPVSEPESLLEKLPQLRVAQAASTNAAPAFRPQSLAQDMSTKQGPEKPSMTAGNVLPRSNMQVVPRPSVRRLAPRPVPASVPAAMNEYMQQRAEGAANIQTVPNSSSGNSAILSNSFANTLRQTQSMPLGLKPAKGPERKMQIIAGEPVGKSLMPMSRASKSTAGPKKKSAKKNEGQAAISNSNSKSSAAVVTMSSLLLNSLKKSDAVSGADESSMQTSKGQTPSIKDGSTDSAGADGTKKDVDMRSPEGPVKNGLLKSEPTAKIGSEAQIVRNLSSSPTATAGRSRSASEMLGVSSNQNDASGESSASSRPTKRMHLLQSSPMLSENSNTNSKDNMSISSMRSENVTVQNNPDDSSSGSLKSENDNDNSSKPTSGFNPPDESSDRQTLQGQGTMVTIGAPATGVPLLRSSPVSHIPYKGQKNCNAEADVKEKAKMSDVSENIYIVKELRRQPKTVSWAPEEKLLSVAHIDNRIELIKSWDPDFQDTLPFAPPTLANFRAAIANETSHIGNPGMPTKESFEASRQRELQLEHDTEMKRLREAKEALRRKLDAMKLMCNWLPGCMAVVLPVECRLENENIEQFSVRTSEEGESVEIETLPDSPPSPRRKDDIPDTHSSFAVDIPFHDTGPKASSVDENTGASDSGATANTPSSEKPDTMRGVESGRNSRPSFSNGGGFQNQPSASFERHGGNNSKQRANERTGNTGHDGSPRNHVTGFRSQPFRSDNRQADRNVGLNGFRGNFRNDERRDNERGHPHGSGPGGSIPPLPALGSLELQQLLTAIQKGVGPPNLPPGAFQGHPQIGGLGKFNSGGQSGFNPLVGPPGFGIPPPPPGMAMPGLPPGMMVPGMGMGMPPPPHMNMMGMPPPQTQRMDALMPSGRRKKSKKPCKYFSTKQGCRDGSSCMFSHER